MQELKQESIAKACDWFYNNCLAQLRNQKETIAAGKFYCNNPEKNEKRLLEEAEKWKARDYKMTFTLWQRAYQYQTGECVAFLPK